MTNDENNIGKNMIVHNICLSLKDRYYTTISKKQAIILKEYHEIFGCSENKFRTHLENLFTENMIFENHTDLLY